MKLIIIFAMLLSTFVVATLATKSAACAEARDIGLCRSADPRYFFNSSSGQCEMFLYGGCGGNGNRFDSMQLCQSMCMDDL